MVSMNVAKDEKLTVGGKESITDITCLRSKIRAIFQVGQT